MAYDKVLIGEHGDAALRTGVITLNRPKQPNALDDGLMDDLGAALKANDADESIGCIVVTGSQRAFAAGADVAAMAQYNYMDVYESAFVTRNWETIRTVRMPVIAAASAPDWSPARWRWTSCSLFGIADQKEGMAAFLGKRKSAFVHR